eukprot:693821-Hanusia_phi.AAC.1
MPQSKVLLVLLVTEVHSLVQSRNMSVVHVSSSEHAQDVRVSAPAGSEYLISAMVSELDSDKEGSLTPILEVRKGLKLASCNRTC